MEPTAIPKASPEALPELAAYLAHFAPLFRRSTSRHSLERYLTGLLTDLPRKNCDTIASAVAGTSSERLQHLLTDAAWDPLELDRARVAYLLRHTPPGGVLVLDDTGLIKQGHASVGTARQYSGTLGKIGNCQVIVTAEYLADEPDRRDVLHWPVSGRLYLPETWAREAERRRRAHVPEQIAFETKPEIALGLIDQAQAWGVPFRYVVTDAGYGDNPLFLAGLEARALAFVVALSSDFGVRLAEQVRAAASAAAPYQGRGAPKKPRPAPLYQAQQLLAKLPEEAWQTINWRQASSAPAEDGPLCKQFAALRVHWGTGSKGLSTTDQRVKTGGEGWLLGERPLPGQSGDRAYYFSSLPEQTPLRRLVELAKSRWPIEQFYEDAKGECGLDDYQGRRWEGLHRHLALVMLAYSFLVMHRSPAPSAHAVGVSPLGASALPAGSTPADAGLAAAGSGALVHRDRTDKDVSPTANLTE